MNPEKFLLFALLLSGFPCPAQYKFENATYKETIRTVRLHLDGDNKNLYSAASLQEQNLVLEFDELTEDKAYFFVKLINATQDWKKSPLANLDYLPSYNEFPINDYQYSNTGSTPYIHYKILIPSVSVAGNYLILVYQDNEDNPVLTQRMMIYDRQLSYTANSEFSGLGTLATANQPFNFFVSYTGDLINPAQNITVIIRQNQRWDNTRTLTPFNTREDIRQLEYRQPDSKDQFLGGNEFRFVDFRSLFSPGQNTDRTETNKNPIEVYVNTDKPRAGQAYTKYMEPEKNGNYYTQNSDQSGGMENYVNVHFKLESPLLKSNVYVIGAFNNWARNDQNKMKYEAASKSYTATLYLKQGYYNYLYYTDNKANGFEIEGSHFETENFYEVLIYYNSFRPRTDLLLGYFATTVNPAR